jgi:pimeloyl-ACP methyl ester carboxylesterase
VFDLLLIASALYLAALAVLYLAQRRLLYFPNPREIPPADVGLRQAERLHLRTDDGERLLAWRIPPPPGAPMILYLHGNGGGIGLRANRYAAFAAAGFGVLALEYRGYGGSTGAPSEPGLTRDAEAAYQAALQDTAPERIVLLGESLGSGLAVKLGARHAVGAVVLDSPYTSIAEVAASKFWMFPVRRLIRDAYDSLACIAEVKAPLLIVHGTRDPVVPIRFGRKLFERATAQKTFIAVEGAGHLALDARLDETIAWIVAQMGPRP